MGKAVMVEHYWSKSVTAKITKVVSKLNIDGNETTTEYPAETESFVTKVSAGSSVHFSIDTYGEDGQIATSEVHSYTVGTLEAPLPATDLGHRFLSIVDDTNNPTPTPLTHESPKRCP